MTYQKFFIFYFILFTIELIGTPSDQKIKCLYSSLDPSSISQQLAFYDLYPNHPYGNKALQDAWALLSVNNPQFTNSTVFSSSVVYALNALLNKQNDQELPVLDEALLRELEVFTQDLPHRKLKGHSCISEEAVLLLGPEQIDLSRGLFLSELGSDLRKIRTYETLLDLMAIQVMARLPAKAGPEEKILAINHLIFEEMGFRFPPNSISTKDIDIFTHLPSVLDSHRGVCLGVSVVYICLAQRLDLKLEMITPPGHIYIRYNDGKKVINIETTARGIHLDSDHYLSVDTHALQQRNIKEVIGLVHFNQAAVYWQQQEFEKAKQAYLRAQPYLKHDFLLKELMGYIYLLTGNVTEGESLLNEVKDHIPAHALTKNYLAEDYFAGRLDIDCLKVVYTQPEEHRTSLLNQKKALESVLNKYPKFRTALMQLGLIWIKLHRYGEALDIFKQYYAIDPSEPELNYYLAILYGHQQDYPNAWKHLREAEAFTHAKGYHPKILRDTRRELLLECPE